LPVAKIFGVGKVTAAKLERIGVVTCGDLQAFSVYELVERFGSFGARLHDLAHGVDNRQVKPDRRRKSLSVEHTYPEDLEDAAACLQQLPGLIEELRTRLAKVSEDYWPTKAVVKMKFDDFSQTTVERGLESVEAPGFDELINELCREAFARKKRPVRLLGTGVRLVDLKAQENPNQLGLFSDQA